MKILAIVAATACALLAGKANAERFGSTEPANPPLVQQTHGHGGNSGGRGDGGRWGRDSGVGVVVDVPMTGAGYGNVPAPAMITVAKFVTFVSRVGALMAAVTAAACGVWAAETSVPDYCLGFEGSFRSLSTSRSNARVGWICASD